MATKNYPQLVNAEIAERCAHIPDAEIARDIADTQREIDQYKALREAEQQVMRNHPHEGERRMAAFRASARDGQIDERERFVAFLVLLQKWRANEQCRPENEFVITGTETGRFSSLGSNIKDVDRDAVDRG